MITRPITRVEFLLGKILGLVLLVMVNILVLSFATVLMVYVFGGSIQSIFIFAIMFLFLESLIVILWSLTASLLTSRLITGLATFVMYFAGHVIGEIKQASIVLSNHFFKYMIVAAESTLPMLYKINLKIYVQYPTQLPHGFIATGVAYGVLYILILVFLSIYIFKRKELD
jgi:ABC-type transport system involved in multi-copper enzyme maturation permease subunit